MDPTACRRYLESLLNDVDRGRPPRRRARLLSAVAMATAMCLAPGCDESGETKAEICDNELDDDDDGRTDCDDQDCYNDDWCYSTSDYSAPMDSADSEADCGDKADNDLDGLVDCDDTDCTDAAECAAGAYSAPFE